MSHRVWLRVKLSESELASLQQEAPDSGCVKTTTTPSIRNGFGTSMGYLPKTHCRAARHMKPF